MFFYLFIIYFLFVLAGPRSDSPPHDALFKKPALDEASLIFACFTSIKL